MCPVILHAFTAHRLRGHAEEMYALHGDIWDISICHDCVCVILYVNHASSVKNINYWTFPFCLVLSLLKFFCYSEF